MASITFNGQAATVIITGCSSGIGKATAELAKKSGFNVVGLDINEPAPGLVDKFVKGDLGTEEGYKAAGEALGKAVEFKAGESYYLINNAGVQDTRHNALNTPDDVTKRIMNVCLHAPLELSRWFVGAIKTLGNKHKDASIVNIGSIQVVGNSYGQIGPYTVAKASIHDGVTKVFATNAAAEGVRLRVNTLHPGCIATEGMGKADTAEDVAPIRAACPLGRRGRPDEVATAIIPLMLETYTNMSERVISGGIEQSSIAGPKRVEIDFRDKEDPDAHFFPTKAA